MLTESSSHFRIEELMQLFLDRRYSLHEVLPSNLDISIKKVTPLYRQNIIVIFL